MKGKQTLLLPADVAVMPSLSWGTVMLCQCCSVHWIFRVRLSILPCWVWDKFRAETAVPAQVQQQRDGLAHSFLAHLAGCREMLLSGFLAAGVGSDPPESSLQRKTKFKAGVERRNGKAALAVLGAPLSLAADLLVCLFMDLLHSCFSSCR